MMKMMNNIHMAESKDTINGFLYAGNTKADGIKSGAKDRDTERGPTSLAT
jgi:hypothetical protein